MDHVSANPSVHVSTREHISSMRVFDGEDQGKFYFKILTIQVPVIDTEFSKCSSVTGASNR